ncbi:unnamed protein product [Orchesella dallaii]|uniref:Protein kinase domain-containing protein n=1 Tax=Orchesella dallaii TaxID=48710 RepID=A0ABP1PHX7_9HEXA
MEDSQKQHIMKHLAELVESTWWSSSLLIVPLQENVFSEGDITMLESIRNQTEKVLRFYQLFMTKISGYEYLISTLTATNQTGALQILYLFQDSNSPQFEQQDIQLGSIVRTQCTLVGNGEIGFYKSEPLGRGHNTTVFTGYYGSEPAAIKKMYCNGETDFRDKEKEFNIWMNLNRHNHINIPKLFGKEKEDEFIYIAMEPCNGTLRQLIKNEIPAVDRWDIADLDILKQATQGLAFLHEQEVIHRDLKPENILILLHQGQVCVKIADFGISRTLPEDKNTITITWALGTQGWRAPEVLSTDSEDKLKMSRETDIFSLGCIYYYVLSNGLHPFGEDSKKREKNIIDSKFLLKDEHIPELPHGLRNTIESMIQKDRRVRPSAKKLLRDLFQV